MTRRTAAAVAVAIGLAAPAGATASTTQESLFMDDHRLVYSSPAELNATLDELKQLGVDRIRVSVVWRIVAPGGNSTNRPAFGPGGEASPTGYGAEAWDRYDRIVVEAGRRGIAVLLCLAPPAPLWATRSDDPFLRETYNPSPADYGAFATAAGRRYSGSYADENDGGATLPRVTLWSVWNEPNQPPWLTPQWLPDAGSPGGFVPASGRVYRELFDAAAEGLATSGHPAGEMLVGETAPVGVSRMGRTEALRPLAFVRELYCLDSRLRPYAGSAAEARGCPTDPEGGAAFPRSHPALFAAAGYAHHPYGLLGPPERGARAADDLSLADLGRLTRALDSAFATYGAAPRLPIWLTEYGYESDPPDPYLGVPWRTQGEYLNRADRIAYANPRVASAAQFLLTDTGPDPAYQPGDARRWGNFQTGLETFGGRRKTAWYAYRRPLVITPSQLPRSRRVDVFGQLRGFSGAGPGGPLRARLELRRPGSRRFRLVKRLSTTNPRGFVHTRLRLPAPGLVRLAWSGPGVARGEVSRTARVAGR